MCFSYCSDTQVAVNRFNEKRQTFDFLVISVVISPSAFQAMLQGLNYQVVLTSSTPLIPASSTRRIIRQIKAEAMYLEITPKPSRVPMNSVDENIRVPKIQ